MLLRLMPDQIPDHWEFIKLSLDKTFVSTDKQEYNKILSKLLTDEMTCWVITDEVEVSQAKGITITTFTRDVGLEKGSLLIYSFCLFEKTDVDTLDDAFETLAKYADHTGCSEIYAFSNVPGVFNVAKRFGANIETRRISFPLGG